MPSPSSRRTSVPASSARRLVTRARLRLGIAHASPHVLDLVADAARRGARVVEGRQGVGALEVEFAVGDVAAAAEDDGEDQDDEEDPPAVHRGGCSM